MHPLQTSLGSLLILASLGLAACGKPDAPAAVAPVLPAFQAAPELTAAALAAMPSRGTCSIDTVVALPGDKPQPAVNNTFTVALNADVKFIGFATDSDKGEPLGRFTLLLSADQTFTAQAAAGLERQDVADFFKKPGLLKAGFHADLSLKGVPAGEYTIILRDGDGPLCQTHHKLKIG